MAFKYRDYRRPFASPLPPLYLSLSLSLSRSLAMRQTISSMSVESR